MFNKNTLMIKLLPYAITIEDIAAIATEIGATHILNGNQPTIFIELPLTEHWKTIMSISKNYNIRSNYYHNKRRIMFYCNDSDSTNGCRYEKLIRYSTVYGMNKDSVITYEDITSISNAVIKITQKKIQVICIDNIISIQNELKRNRRQFK